MVGNLNPFTAQSVTEYTRLHITPLNPTLLTCIVSQPILPLVRNTSYHSLQTFPEKEFGFVDLPLMEAQRIKKKLNGSILKGIKVKIEDARPLRLETGVKEIDRPIPVCNDNGNKRPVKRRRKDVNTIPAVEIRGRNVKRGWTDLAATKRSDKRSASKKSGLKPKYTSKRECLFRTTIPPNVTSLQDAAAPDLKAVRKTRKSKGKDVIVHEFSKTTKYATFLRSSGISSTARSVSEYVDGTGWIDQDGNVIESAITANRKSPPLHNKAHKTTDSSAEVSGGSEIEVKSDNDISVGEGIAVGLRDRVQEAAHLFDAAIQGSLSSSSESSLDDEISDGIAENNTSDKDFNSHPRGPTSPTKGDEQNYPMKRLLATSTSLKLEIPQLGNLSGHKSTLHPLEALFKRRRSDSNTPEIPNTAPSFTFFNADGKEDEVQDAISSIPMTPYTKRDFALRGQRSAAPTPDTAYPGKTFIWPKKDSDDENGGEDASPTGKHNIVADSHMKEVESEPVTDFQKWFYEHRGEANRAWKKRRKVAGKEKRHRENRKTTHRDV